MSGPDGEAPFDVWTLAHLATGLAFGAIQFPWLWMLIALVLYEVLEAVLRRFKRKGKGLFEYESWKNIAVDIVVAVAGYVLAFWLVPDFVEWW